MGSCFSVAFNGENNSGIWQKLLHALKIFSKKSGKNDPAEAVEFEEVEERKKRKLSTKKAIKSPPRKRREIPPKIELNEEIIEEYIVLEKSLRRLERRGIVEKFEAKSTEIDELRRTLTQMEATQKELKKGTEKTRADLDNLAQPGLKLLLRRLGTMDERMENGRKQFDEALAKEEMAEKELNATKKEYEKARKIADFYGEWANRMVEMFGREQQILGGLSGEEFVGLKQLDELDAAIEWQQRIEMAKFKWTNARILLVHASTQIVFGISHWKELSRLDPLNASRMRYFSAVEARNNFQLAAQNIQTCRVYLDRVKFPYGTEEEMQQMENALQTAFNDVQSNASLKRALTICQGVHKSVHSLIIWFDKVISETILKDLDKANANVSKRQRQIREFGLEMMGKLVREKFGRELRIDEGENEEQTKAEEDEFEQKLKEIEKENEFKYEEETGPDIKEDEEKEPVGMKENDEKKQADDNDKENVESKMSDSEDNVMEKAETLNEEARPNVSSSNNSNYAPIPLNQLAPIPSKDVLFEEIQQKLNKLEQIRTTKERWNELIRERQRMALQEKLRIRLIQKRQQRRKLINRRKSSIQPFPSSISRSIEEFTSSSSQN